MRWFPALCVLCSVASAFGQSPPADFLSPIATDKPQVLFLGGRPSAVAQPLPPKCPLVSLDDLQFVGPNPSHPFVLGNFATDAAWGVQDGYLQVVSGKNAALQLAWADQFELEGIAHQSGYGGWFVLFGWSEGHGLALHSVSMKDSGSPWFLTEFRGYRAINDRTQEFEKFEWRNEQPFKLAVGDDKLSLTVGKFKVFDQLALSGYHPGAIVLGVYDTRYGPRTMKVKSLRIKSLPAKTQAVAP